MAGVAKISKAFDEAVGVPCFGARMSSSLLGVCLTIAWSKAATCLRNGRHAVGIGRTISATSGQSSSRGFGMSIKPETTPATGQPAQGLEQATEVV